MIDLLENGTIYFNTIEYFQKLENNEARGDKYEGTTNIQNFNESDKYILTITDPKTGKEIKMKTKKVHLRQFLTEMKGNIYSMYCLKSPEVLDPNFKTDKKVKEFGSHVVIIKNVDRFVQLICKKLDELNILYRGQLVNYYEKNKVHGDITVFDKSMEFEYQKEYRIVLYSNQIKPFIIKIGNINEIAELFEVKALDEMKIDWVDKTV